MDHMRDLRKHGLFDQKVPRFTSYPPANRFGAGTGAAEFGNWLAATPDGSDLSIYVHIPFCRNLCYFCACRTQGTKSDGPLARYVAAVLAEARAVRAHLPEKIRIARVHFGGGTPTILPVSLSRELLAGLDEIFGLGQMDEFSVEIDPNEIDDARLDILVAHGMTRVVLGVQDFDPKVQATIGRVQSVKVTAQVLRALRARGVNQIDFDLLYGLPFQTPETLTRTLDNVLALGPTRLALYGYAHVPWMSRRQSVIPTEALPGAVARLGLFQMAGARILDAGFTRMGTDTFVRPEDGLARAAAEKRLTRSFQGYTDDRAPRLLGLGASSISRFPEGYSQNEPATSAYLARVEHGGLAAGRGIVLTDEDRVRARLIQALMCYHQICLSEDAPGDDEALGWLTALTARYPDAIEFDGDRFRLKDWALPLVRIVAAALGQAEGAPEKTYSAAI